MYFGHIHALAYPLSTLRSFTLLYSLPVCMSFVIIAHRFKQLTIHLGVWSHPLEPGQHTGGYILKEIGSLSASSQFSSVL